MVVVNDQNISMESLIPNVITGTLKTMLQTTPGPAVTPIGRHRLEYTVTEQTEDYETRVYPCSTWLCTTVAGVYQDAARVEAFRRLLAYSQGENADAAQLSIKPPILTRVSSEGTGGFERKFIVCTHLSTSDGTTHPEPTSPNVYIEHLPEMTVFVSRFQGISCEERWTNEARQLAEVLSRVQDIRTDFYFTATYESPFQLVSGRNEIWFVHFDPDQQFAHTKPEHTKLKYGAQSLDIPPAVSTLMCFLMSYFAVISTLVNGMFNVTCLVKDNWSNIRQHAGAVSKSVQQNVSISTLLRTGLSVAGALWNVTVAVITGSSDTNGHLSNRDR
ncbi:HEBP2-like protein [Mya arenaria]|uniref:HEBP2-like protein n=1 Tax=Mya arenaria TaxID=6604 RepID=A0ABY7FK26_MYAAR|nr:uncharacterized protein LOC128212147 [Mya arenaria]WAR21038.1 HEBP2-like protein [Mya arenaria]